MGNCPAKPGSGALGVLFISQKNPVNPVNPVRKELPAVCLSGIYFPAIAAILAALQQWQTY